MLGTVRGALRLGLAVSEAVLGLGLDLVRTAKAVVGEAAPEAEAPPARPAREDTPPARVRPRRAAQREEPPATPPARRRPGRSPTAAVEPAHVDEEPVLAAEFAEEGAEDGAGPQIDIDEPWDGYSGMRAPDVVRALQDASTETLAAVQLYESANRSRRTVLDAAGRLMAQREST